VYEEVYWIILVQARARGNFVRQYVKARCECATFVQSIYRGYHARCFKSKSLQAVCKAQAQWRAYKIRTSFQFIVVDIIIAQSVARRWVAQRNFAAMKEDAYNGAATKIQAEWRGYSTWTDFQRVKAAVRVQALWRGALDRQSYQRYRAATQIQSLWRGFQAYTDYIFSLVDILNAQRTARRWLAIRETRKLREESAAGVIQKHYRRHTAQVNMLCDLVNIIMAQSFARRYLARCLAASIRQERLEIKLEREQAATRIQALTRGSFQRATFAKEKAVVKIQACWRGFWLCSHFIIMRYEASRLQAVLRGKIQQRMYNMQLGCIIMIQSTVRRHLTLTKTRNMKLDMTVKNSAALRLREVNACKHIQFWWRLVMDCRKEKKAALIIERFFIMVKAEVDREIKRAQEKRERRKQKKKEKKSEDQELEKAWLSILDDSGSLASLGSRSVGSKSVGSKSIGSKSVGSKADGTQSQLQTISSGASSAGKPSGTPTAKTPSPRSENKKAVRHRASSPTMRLVMRHDAEYDSPRPIERSHTTLKSKSLLDDETSFSDTSSKAERYRVMYGLKSAPNRQSKLDHFSDDDSRSGMSSFEVARHDSQLQPPMARMKSHMSTLSRYPRRPPSPATPRMEKSPRHAKILVMDPYPDYARSAKQGLLTAEEDEDIELGDEFGLI
jgi:hypothetical protein